MALIPEGLMCSSVHSETHQLSYETVLQSGNWVLTPSALVTTYGLHKYVCHFEPVDNYEADDSTHY